MRANLFDILSSSSAADHPLCDECTDSLLMLMDQQLRMTEGEWSDYNDYLKKLEAEQQQQGNESMELENLSKELADVKTEEERMIQELEALRKEEAVTRNAIAEQESERERLQSEEERYWREYSRHRRDLILAEDECRRYINTNTKNKLFLIRIKALTVFSNNYCRNHLQLGMSIGLCIVTA